MSLRSLESAITLEARELLNNRKLRVKDIQEWSTHPVTPHTEETTLYLPRNAVYIAVPKYCDKRVPT